MSAAGPRLRDIHLPPVSWWPPAIGWWLLGALILMALSAGVFVWWHGRKARQLRRAAQRELAALTTRHARDRNHIALAAGLSRLLRRIALRVHPAVVADNGAAWREFLSQRAHSAFTAEQLDVLTAAPYRAHASFDADALIAATKRWCRHALRARPLSARNRS